MPEKSPSNLSAFAYHLYAKEMLFGIWIDPRIAEHAESYPSHRDIVIPADFDSVYGNATTDGLHRLIVSVPLVDLGRPEGQQWFLEQLIRFAEEYRADCLWFDLNTDPRLLIFDHIEEDERRGIAELGYYRGFYRVLDEVREHCPNVWIECCTNGGRLIDLGILRRCHSVWKNDYVGFWGIGHEPDADISRSLTTGLNCFLPAVYVHSGPYLPEEIVLHDTPIMDDYHYLSHFAGSLAFGQGLIRWKDDEVEHAAKLVAAWKRVRDVMHGDYYPLFPQPTSRADWDGWQYHDPCAHRGAAAVFRLAESREGQQRVRLRGLNGRRPGFEMLAGAGEVTWEGDELVVTLEPRGAVLLEYA